MNADARRQRQLEYEENLNRWADIGKKRQKILKEKLKKCTGFPFWYTEFSLLQLQYLKELKDTMFKDKEEQTTFRTLNALSNIGMITETSKVESKIVRKYLNKYNKDPIRFLCEIYKAISGNYFENEQFKCYNCTERIILSGIAFLELPKIILELQKRLPPIIKETYFPKPKPPEVRRPIKAVSPYLEKLLMPPDWRVYRANLQKWRNKCSASVKPVVILPKIVNTQNKRETAEEEKEESSVTLQKEIEEKHSEIIEPIQPAKSFSEEKSENNMIKDDNQDNNQDNNQDKISEINLQETVDTKYKQTTHSFSMQNWTNPPSPCPYKYRKLMEKVGPVKTDEEFFTELGYENKKKFYAPGRENLSVNMQSYLLGLETDLYKVTDDIDKLTCKVGAIAKEILESDHKCHPCCVCEQTQKTVMKSHTMKSPHLMIDSIVPVEDDKTRVIGATAMHSPVSSISSIGEPLRIPSCDKIVKNVIITGTTTTIDGETVKQVDGVTKAIEHVPHHILRPEIQEIEIKNVPPCACSKEAKDKNEADKEIIGKGSHNVDVCYGRKYRPDEGPAYSCGEFKNNEPVEEDYERKEYSDKFVVNNSDCGCGIEFKKCSLDDEAEYANSIVNVKSEFENIQKYGCEVKSPYRICKKCEKKVDTKCETIPIKSRILLKNKHNKKLRKQITDQCSCHSLSEYLKFDVEQTSDLRKFTKEPLKGQIITKKKESNSPSNTRKSSINYTNICRQTDSQIADITDANAIPNSLDTEINKKACPLQNKVARKVSCNQDVLNKNAEEEEEEEEEEVEEEETEKLSSPKQTSSNGGPYGLRTKSEEKLPAEYTVAYLVPPKYPLCYIPTAKGHSSCKCRENRNNRKILLYNIGGTVDEVPEPSEDPTQEDFLPRVIEGVTWLTPEPSIRRSDEYVPEYELYDSPYDKMCKVSTKALTCSVNTEVNNNATTSRSQDWENSFNDLYLTEFYTKNKAKVSCTKKCPKFPQQNEKPRKLRVMKPVCECKYERKIVKKNEERKKSLDRQNQLKSFKKEPDASSPAPLDPNLIATQTSNRNDILTIKYCGSDVIGKTEQPQVAASAVTLPTSVVTPHHQTTHNPNSFDTSSQSKISDKATENLQITVDKSQDKSLSKNEFSKDRKEHSAANENQLIDKHHVETENKMMDTDTNLIDTPSKPKAITKTKKSPSFYDNLEEQLRIKMRHELEKMATEDFISVKLPAFHKMPQLLYWISYRTKGMNFRDNPRDLMKESTSKNKWSIINARVRRKNGPPLLRITKKDKETLNFNRAMYWKKKIADYKLKFYTQLRHDILNLSRDVWPLMEFGKFPDIIFKQTYFTYLPSREKDAQTVRLWIA